MLVIDLNRLVVGLKNGVDNQQMINNIMTDKTIRVQLIDGKKIDLFSPKIIEESILGENEKITIAEIVYLWLM